MVEIRVTKKNGVATIDLPSDMLDRLGIADGATIHAAETDAGIVLSAQNITAAEQLRIAESVMDRYRDVLRRLAQ